MSLYLSHGLFGGELWIDWPEPAWRVPDRYFTSCAGKERFATWRDANKAARRMRRIGRRRMSAYRCKWCGGRVFHVGRTTWRHASLRRLLLEVLRDG